MKPSQLFDHPEHCPCAAQVQALRSIEKHLNLDKLYVLGTNCVDNGPRQGLEKFLKAASSSPETALHYEFMQVGTVASALALLHTPQWLCCTCN